MLNSGNRLGYRAPTLHSLPDIALTNVRAYAPQARESDTRKFGLTWHTTAFTIESLQISRVV
jgi:hypothetical protein